jgi:hypothetical protein
MRLMVQFFTIVLMTTLMAMPALPQGSCSARDQANIKRLIVGRWRNRGNCYVWGFTARGTFLGNGSGCPEGVNGSRSGTWSITDNCLISIVDDEGKVFLRWDIDFVNDDEIIDNRNGAHLLRQ